MIELPSGLDEIEAVLGPLAAEFDVAGFSLYLVGGVVRDLYIGGHSTIDDLDLTTDALPQQIKGLVEPFATAIWAQGEKFGTIGATIDGRAVEITTHRAEVYSSSTRKPSVEFGTAITDDLIRRDFTLNAMAIQLPGREFLDPHNGLDDLEQRCLRTPASPEVSFSDDPLRMFRAARFMARFDLVAESSLIDAARDLAARIKIVSVERVQAETERLLALPNPERGLRFLFDTDLLPIVIPSLGTQSNRSKALRLAAMPGSVLVRRAGLLFFVPDPTVVLRGLHYPLNEIKQTANVIDQAKRVLSTELSPSLIRRAVDAVGRPAVSEVIALLSNIDNLKSCDERTGVADQFETAYRLLARDEDLDDLGSPVSGGELIAELGIEPGPAVGLLVKYLTGCRMETGPISRSEAIERARQWHQNLPDRASPPKCD